MKNYSIAIFGSSLRKDFDKYSDRDLLIVAKDNYTLKKLKSIYSNKEWSISFYTYSKLNYLSSKGSLFIKHLKEEAKIIIDKKAKLNRILNDFEEKQSYKKDVENSLNYFKILDYIPDDKLGYAWFCDSFYVGLRNFLIFRNAENHIYEFSFNKLLKSLSNVYEINENDINILKELRIIKRNYRESIYDELPSKDFIVKIIVISNKLGLLQSTSIVDKNKYQQIIEHNILKDSFDAYQRLRLIESYYNTKKVNIPRLKKVINNPNFYTMKLKDNKYTMKLINSINNATQQRAKAIAVTVLL